VVVQAEMGQIRGANLFHSFDQLNVPDRGSVTFTGPETIDNILGRVTGGMPSRIDGSLRSVIPGANLYLINPAGILFGLHARLDVDGAVHISTADVIRFTDRERFSANPRDTSVLTIAPPTAFGFIQPQPAPIAINGGQLNVAGGSALSIVGGDIHIQGDTTRFSIAPNLTTQSGPMTIVSVASPGEVMTEIADVKRYTRLDGFERLGKIVISDGARLQTAGPPGGMIAIRGEQLVVDDSIIMAQSARDVHETSVGIDIDTSGDMIVRNGSHIETSPSIAGHTGAVWVAAGGSITVSTEGERGAPSSISSFATAGVDAGNIVITAGRAITIAGQRADILSSHISSEATAGGQSGDITLSAPILYIDGGVLSSGITVDFFFVQAGDIVVRTETMTLVNGGRVDSSYRGSTQGGTITITAQESITIAGTSIEGHPSGIRSQPLAGGNPGRITLITPTLDMEGGVVSTVALRIWSRITSRDA
jgi:filamentous hemagglutinin family protein